MYVYYLEYTYLAKSKIDIYQMLMFIVILSYNILLIEYFLPSFE